MPRRDYFESLVRHFVTENARYYDLTVPLADNGLALSANLEIVPLHELPDGFESYSSLDMTSIRPKLPSNLIVNGHLDIRETDTTHVGPLSVRASMKITSNQNIERIEGKLSVGSWLSLLSCENLVSLPDGLEIPGTLRISYCEKLVELPRGLDVGELDLQNSSVKKLPNDIKISRRLDISLTEIDKNELPAHLPDDLVVKFDVFQREKTLGQIRKGAKGQQKKADMEDAISPKM